MNVMNPNITMMSVAAGEGWISRVDTLSSVKPNLRISDLHFEELVTIKRHVVMQHAVNCVQ